MYEKYTVCEISINANRCTKIIERMLNIATMTRHGLAKLIRTLRILSWLRRSFMSQICGFRYPLPDMRSETESKGVHSQGSGFSCECECECEGCFAAGAADTNML